MSKGASPSSSLGMEPNSYSSALDDPFILSRLQPAEYYRKWMETNMPIRPSQRSVHEGRPFFVQSGTITTAEASSTVRLGDTIVVTGVKLEVAEAETETETEMETQTQTQTQTKDTTAMTIVANVTLCAGSAPSVRSGPPNAEAQELSHQLGRLVASLNLVAPLQKKESSLRWILHLDSLVINDAGNLFSALWLGILKTLATLRLPRLSMDEEAGIVRWNVEDTTPLPMRFTRLIPIRFVRFGDTLILDPDEQEEALLAPAHVNLLLDPKGMKPLFLEAQNTPFQLIKQTLASDALRSYVLQISSQLGQ